MIPRGGPLRFLALVVGGWVCVRAAMLAPGDPPHPTSPAIASSTPQLIGQGGGALNGRADIAVNLLTPSPQWPKTAVPIAAARSGGTAFGKAARMVPDASTTSAQPVAHSAAEPPSPRPLPHPIGPALGAAPTRSSPAQVRSRWSGSAWIFARRGSGSPLVPTGTLSGSQAGGRLSYRLNEDRARSLALSARLYAPLDDADAAEVAVGLDWQPTSDLPVRLLAERRQAIGDDGRSAFSLFAYGGVSDRPLLRSIRVDAYGQAGIVGLRSRDLFVDGAVRARVPLSRSLSAGIGAWGAAQPGLSRLDAGPTASLRIPLAGASVTLAADWRFRVAGEARPRSGPALTLSTDF